MRVLRLFLAATIATASCAAEEGACEPSPAAKQLMMGAWTSEATTVGPDARPSYAARAQLAVDIDRANSIVRVEYARGDATVVETWRIERSVNAARRPFRFIRSAHASCVAPRVALDLRLLDSTIAGSSDTSAYGDGTAAIELIGGSPHLVGPDRSQMRRLTKNSDHPRGFATSTALRRCDCGGMSL